MCAFYSSTETAFGCLNKYKFKVQADAGNKTAALIVRLYEHFDTTLISVLIGNNLFAIALSTVSTWVFMTEASTTRSPSRPCTRSLPSTTAMRSWSSSRLGKRAFSFLPAGLEIASLRHFRSVAKCGLACNNAFWRKSGHQGQSCQRPARARQGNHPS